MGVNFGEFTTRAHWQIQTSIIIPIILLVLNQVFLAEETLANLWSFSSVYSYQSFKFPYVWTTVLGDYR